LKTSKNHISFLFLFAAVFGIMLSMMHYHSEGLECLHHAEEQHYTQNELLCPAAGIVAVNGAEAQPLFDDLIKFPEEIIIANPLFLSQQPFTSLLGRAPPTLI